MFEKSSYELCSIYSICKGIIKYGRCGHLVSRRKGKNQTNGERIEKDCNAKLLPPERLAHFRETRTKPYDQARPFFQDPHQRLESAIVASVHVSQQATRRECLIGQIEVHLVVAVKR
jgi:hypothetical protein